MNNDHKLRNRYIPEPGIGYTERNTNRWAIYGSQHSKIERILTRADREGRVVETCHIGAVGYKGKMRSLSKIHGKLMNIIEWFFFKLNKPADNLIKISTLALYDYLTDIHSMFDESKRKNRQGIKFRDWLYDTLHVLSQVVLMFSSWETKEGPSGARSFKIIKSFRMWGKHKDAERGLVIIELDPDYANSLRARNTAPLLIEVENSIQGEIAYTLYRYLRQILFKTPHFKIRILELQKRLAIGHSRKDRLADDFRTACRELEGKAIPNGSIAACRIENVGREVFLVAELGKRSVLPAAIKNAQRHMKSKEEELERMMNADARDAQIMERYKGLPRAEKDNIDRDVEQKLSMHRWGYEGAPGYETTKRSIILDLMEKYHLSGIDQMGGSLLVDIPHKNDTLRDKEQGLATYLPTEVYDGIRRLRDALELALRAKCALD